MNRFRVARQAEEDLEGLWVHIARHSRRNADRFLSKLLAFRAIPRCRKNGQKNRTWLIPARDGGSQCA
jgi:plasmid stabilization system protein ParE